MKMAELTVSGGPIGQVWFSVKTRDLELRVGWDGMGRPSHTTCDHLNESESIYSERTRLRA